jgi:uncharacterized protein DUF6171
MSRETAVLYASNVCGILLFQLNTAVAARMNRQDWRALFEPIDVSAAAPATPAPDANEAPASAGPLERVVSFSASVARFAAGGFQVVSQEVREQRQAACRQCEHFSRGSCLICGCFILPKTALPHEACPIARWHAVG